MNSEEDNLNLLKQALHLQKCFKDFLNSESRVERFISFGLRKASLKL